MLAGIAWLAAVPTAPANAAGKPQARHGMTLYVSKRGDNSDGSSWAKAFHTIQAALQAVPDARGGHRIVVRPDTYMEANLFPAHKGASGAYNLLVGDVDGRLGSGAKGWAVIDCGDPAKGFKSYDWWGPIRAYQKGWSAKHTAQTFSAIGWDRWTLRHVYATGGDGGLFWDLVGRGGEGFTVVVEDCVGIGRAFGGGFGYPVVRKGEPIVFRRCYLMCLDWWGDAGAAAVGGHEKALPDHPHALFDDCTLVGPDNAIQILNPSRYVRVKLRNCRLIVLNFSQPHGTPSTGIVCCDRADPKYPHIDLEDCTLMGYMVFGTGGRPGRIAYTTRGRVRAYVQFQQPVPEGMERLTRWPTDVFQALAPPSPAGQRPLAALAERRLVKLAAPCEPGMEQTPVAYQGRPLLVACFRPAGHDPKPDEMSLYVKDLRTGRELARFGKRHSFVSAFVEGGELSVFATEYSDGDWTHDVYRFASRDLKAWKRDLAIRREPGEHLFNTSVCRGPQGYVMAYESNVPVQFCFKFARSKDLARWEKLDGLVFTGEGREYSACPVLRYVAPHYYVIYLHAGKVGDKDGWVSYLARSTDLVTWELSPRNPILVPSEGEGTNNSDVDLFEVDGHTYIFYATGDQATWGVVRCALFPGPMAEFFRSHFPDGAETRKVTTRHPR